VAYQPINFDEKLGTFAELWAPRVVAELNDYQFKLAKVQGDFVWHSHVDTDEAFIVLAGHLRIEFRDGAVEMGQGELYVVPKGVEHRPVAAEECRILLLEPKGVVNTGDADSELTAPNDVWA
jgi:mannose-6-phosphate isomerase-like protein (cupin superfamily)